MVEHIAQVLRTIEAEACGPRERGRLLREIESTTDLVWTRGRLECEDARAAERGRGVERQGFANAIEFEGAQDGRLHGSAPEARSKQGLSHV
jgi:hypothetical protein